jgi:methyl-accepting chemotaxis protein I, serine sensor receptor
MRKLTIKARLLILTLAVAVISLGVGAAGLVGVSKSIEALQQMFEGRAKSLQAISTINELVTEATFSVSDAILDPSAQKTQLVASGTAARIEQVDGLMKQYVASSDSDDERKRASQFESNWDTLRDKGLRPAVQLLTANNFSEAQWVQTQTIDPVLAP